MPENKTNTNKVALITGAAKRIGAAIVTQLHHEGYRVVVHYHTAQKEAEALVHQLNEKRPDSAIACSADLSQPEQCHTLIKQASSQWQRLDALINNAAVFQATPAQTADYQSWQTIINTNLTSPFFLAQAAFPFLQKVNGSIINITDTHADGRPLKNYAVYNISKAGLHMLTQTLAREFAPNVRVNAVAPGVSLWNDSLTPQQQEILTRTPLKRSAHATEIANAISYLLNTATYTTGSVLYVDGGRLVFN